MGWFRKLPLYISVPLCAGACYVVLHLPVLIGLVELTMEPITWASMAYFFLESPLILIFGEFADKIIIMLYHKQCVSWLFRDLLIVILSTLFVMFLSSIIALAFELSRRKRAKAEEVKN
jgi:hypothetical protein